MPMNFHREAEPPFNEALPQTKLAASPVIELLSEGFQVTWFRETGANLWQAVVKPTKAISDHFGLRGECFVIGNGYQVDFQQRTLKQAPPDHLIDRLDTSVLFVASDAPIAEAFCAAWAQKNKATVVVIRSANPSDRNASEKDRLYSLLSASLWRRDFFAEAEPVRDPSEFFGRELVVNELLAKLLVGAPVALFGLRKIGKSSLLGRLEDLLVQDQSGVTATAFLIGNSTSLTTGRWWHFAQLLISTWQAKLQRLASQLNSKVYAKAERVSDLVSRKVTDEHQLATAFEKDVRSLLKAATALKNETGRDSVRLVLLLDECDHLYPHLVGAGYWKSDFFAFWNSLQSIKRSLESPEELVYMISGVNPSGVEQGSLEDQPNPLYETQRRYLGPMTRPEADLLLTGLGGRMGLIFDSAALQKTYELVGGHPLLLRRLGTAVHDLALHRSERKTVTERDVERAFERRKRDLFNQVNWFLEHLARVAPDEERLLRDIARGGAQAYAELWGEDEFRETFAYHLEQYGLVHFDRDLPEISLSLVREALQKPVASEYAEQKRQLKDAVETIEQAVRIRLRVDLERNRSPEEAVALAVSGIPSDAKNRALSRQQLLELGALAGLGAVLDSLNWGDYEILFDKNFDEITWVDEPMAKIDRLKMLKATFSDAHLVRHNNDHKLKEMIDQVGFGPVYERFSTVREMLSA